MREFLLIFSGAQLFLVRPRDYGEEGPQYRRLCMGLLWLPGVMGHLALVASMAQLWIRYFGKHEERAGPFAYASIGALATFWGCVGASMLLFRMRGPRGKQWEQFKEDLVVWAPWPGILALVALYGAFAVGAVALWRSAP